jgi:hypothetical protein
MPGSGPSFHRPEPLNISRPRTLSIKQLLASFVSAEREPVRTISRDLDIVVDHALA